MEQTPNQLAVNVIDRCKSLGFVLAGIAPAEPTSHEPALRRWLAEGKHGEMAYLERNLEALLDPRKVLAGARSVICVADRYHDGTRDAAPLPEPRAGRIARYARGEDYHKVIKRRLQTLCDSLRRDFPEEKFRACVDTAPLLEREYAKRAGLGAVGKHTLLIEPGVGSYLLLGEVLTTMELVPSEPMDDDPCGSCTRCIDACPTDAISPWSVDATKCISYLTIEHRSVIDERFHDAMGDWVFGCDVCQEVCPHNQPTKRSLAAPLHSAYGSLRDGFDVLEILNWTEDDRRVVFTRSALKRARLAMMKRNALIAAGNAIARHGVAEHGELLERIRAIAGDDSEDEMVRDAATRVLARAGGA